MTDAKSEAKSDSKSLWDRLFGAPGSGKTVNPNDLPGPKLGVVRHAHAMRVIFFYPGEEGTYIDHAEVTLFDNGIVHIRSPHEETTTHLQNCEILWTFAEAEERGSKVRLLRRPEEADAADDEDGDSDDSDDDEPSPPPPTSPSPAPGAGGRGKQPRR